MTTNLLHNKVGKSYQKRERKNTTPPPFPFFSFFSSFFSLSSLVFGPRLGISFQTEDSRPFPFPPHKLWRWRSVPTPSSGIQELSASFRSHLLLPRDRTDSFCPPIFPALPAAAASYLVFPLVLPSLTFPLLLLSFAFPCFIFFHLVSSLFYLASSCPFIVFLFYLLWLSFILPCFT